MPDLVRIAEEVEATNKPRELRRDNTPVAILTPIKNKQSQKAKRKAMEEALALAGAWNDLPADQMEEELDRIRHTSKPTPPIDLDLSCTTLDEQILTKRRLANKQ